MYTRGCDATFCVSAFFLLLLSVVLSHSCTFSFFFLFRLYIFLCPLFDPRSSLFFTYLPHSLHNTSHPCLCAVFSSFLLFCVYLASPLLSLHILCPPLIGRTPDHIACCKNLPAFHTFHGPYVHFISGLSVCTKRPAFTPKCTYVCWYRGGSDSNGDGRRRVRQTDETEYDTRHRVPPHVKTDAINAGGRTQRRRRSGMVGICSHFVLRAV